MKKRNFECLAEWSKARGRKSRRKIYLYKNNKPRRPFEVFVK